MDVTKDTVGDSISLEFLLALLPFMSLFGTRLGSLLSISVVLPVNSGCYQGYSRRFYFLGVSSSLVTFLEFVWHLVQDLDLYSVYQVVLPVNSGCYPGYSRRFYFLGVSSSLVTLHVFVWYKTWIFTQYISGLTCQQLMLPWIQ